MKYGLFSGVLWGLDTVILGIGLALAPYIGSVEALGSAMGKAGSLSMARGISYMWGFRSRVGRY